MVNWQLFFVFFRLKSLTGEAGGFFYFVRRPVFGLYGKKPASVGKMGIPGDVEIDALKTVELGRAHDG